jgi:hypothetical protein
MWHLHTADIFCVIIEVPKAVKIHIAVFPVTIPCSSSRYQCFGGTYCLHLQDKKARLEKWLVYRSEMEETGKIGVANES